MKIYKKGQTGEYKMPYLSGFLRIARHFTARLIFNLEKQLDVLKNNYNYG